MAREDASTTLARVDGEPPSRGDTAITSLVGEIGGAGTSRFFGAAFPKANGTAPANGVLTVEVVGRSTTDGHLFGVTSQLQVAARESAASLNQRPRNDLLAMGCSVFDIAMPSFMSGTATAIIPGFGVEIVARVSSGRRSGTSSASARCSWGGAAVPAGPTT